MDITYWLYLGVTTMKYLIQPIKLEPYNLFICDGTFTGKPFLKQKDDTYLLKPDVDCYIGTALDGTRSFIPVSTVSQRGIIVEPTEDGGVQLNMTLPKEIK